MWVRYRFIALVSAYLQTTLQVKVQSFTAAKIYILVMILSVLNWAKVQYATIIIFFFLLIMVLQSCWVL